MKFFVFSLSICLHYLCHCSIHSIETINHDSTNIIDAIIETIATVHQFDVSTINLMSPDDSLVMRNLNEELLSKHNSTSQIIFRLETTADLVNLQGRRRRFSIFFIRNFSDFIVVYERITPNTFWFNGFFIFVLVNGKISNIEDIYERLWKLQIYNVNVLFASGNGSVDFESFNPFTDDDCNDTTSYVVNRYVNGSFTRGFDNIFFNKMKNLHNCIITASTGNEVEPFVTIERSPNGSHQLKGRDIKLIKALAASLNLQVKYVLSDELGYLYENGSATVPLKHLLDGEADLSVADWWIKSYRLNFFDSTTSYISDPIVFLIPPARDLTTLQKLLMPFQPLVWFCTLGSLAIGIVVILAVKQKSKRIQSMVFGNRVTSPFLNFYIAFIGGYQAILPKRIFPRFLLMVFLMYSLVMRTLYQANYYKILQSGVMNNEVSTMDEMLEEGFAFYATSAMADAFRDTTALKNRFENVD